MKPTLHTRRWTGRLMMALVLFAQGVVSANSYAAPAAPAAAPAHHAMACHEKQLPSSSTCLSHCAQADQISIDQVAAPAAPAAVASWKISLPALPRLTPAVRQQQVALDTGPPIPIRFCSFLI